MNERESGELLDTVVVWFLLVAYDLSLVTEMKQMIISACYGPRMMDYGRFLLFL